MLQIHIGIGKLGRNDRRWAQVATAASMRRLRPAHLRGQDIDTERQQGSPPVESVGADFFHVD
jgi:hypothetical protein